MSLLLINFHKPILDKNGFVETPWLLAVHAAGDFADWCRRRVRIELMSACFNQQMIRLGDARVCRVCSALTIWPLFVHSCIRHCLCPLNVGLKNPESLVMVSGFAEVERICVSS